MRAARLERPAGLCFDGVFLVEAVFRFGVARWGVAEPDLPASGVTGDCGTAGGTAKSNERKTAINRESGKAEKEPSIIPLYAELDAGRTNGESVA
jgi:hypothetical protein